MPTPSLTASQERLNPSEILIRSDLRKERTSTPSRDTARRNSSTDVSPCLPPSVCSSPKNQLNSTHCSRLPTETLDLPFATSTKFALHRLFSSRSLRSSSGASSLTV